MPIGRGSLAVRGIDEGRGDAKRYIASYLANDTAKPAWRKEMRGRLGRMSEQVKYSLVGLC
jgi:hypothetical protein